MKKISILLTVAAALSCLNLINTTAFAQGSLTPPPGAPAPVMKSLDQVEARTPLIPGAPGVTYDTNGNYSITQPGSYYLTGNLTKTNAAGYALIRFATNNISLDLNGFTIFGTTGYLGSAIVGGGYGYRVFNGHIVGGTTQTNGIFTQNVGFTYGIEIFTGNVNFGSDCLISHITVRNVRHRGIQASLNSVVENCIVDTAAGEGIIAGSVHDCRAINTGNDAISAAHVKNSVGRCVSVYQGRGISSYQSEPCNVENSTGEAVSGSGISADNVINSKGKSVSSDGISATSALNSSGESTSGTGIWAHIANNCSGTRPGGTAIYSTIGIGCISLGGTNQITHKYNMF